MEQVRHHMASLAIGVIVLTALAIAAQQQQIGAADVGVMAKVHQANQMEIDVGKLAASRGDAQKVRRYGDLLVRDHQMGDRMLTDLAGQKGVQIPAPVPESPAEQEQMQKQMAAMERLKQQQGAAFDRAFTEAMTQTAG